MKELFQKMMKKLRKHSEAAGAIAALLLIVLFSGVMSWESVRREKVCRKIRSMA